MSESHEPRAEFLPTRESLLSRLRDWDDQESWRVFFDTYGRLVYGLAVRSGLTDAEAQDVVQETCLSVAKEMPGFRYDPAKGSFKGWLLKLTRRRIADQFRKRPAWSAPASFAVGQEPAGNEARTATVERIADPAVNALETVWEQEWQHNLAEQAIARVKLRVTARQFQMFHLYAIQQWPMSAVTQTLGVSRAQVYMAKMRVSRLLRQEVHRLQTRGL